MVRFSAGGEEVAALPERAKAQDNVSLLARGQHMPEYGSS